MNSRRRRRVLSSFRSAWRPVDAPNSRLAEPAPAQRDRGPGGAANALRGPLRFAPMVDGGRRGNRFEGAIAQNRLLSGVVELPPRVARPSLPAP